MGNILVGQGKNPLVNNNFLLRVDAVFDIPCKKVSSFQQETEYESIQSGGENDYVYLRKKPASKPYTFQVERYISADYFDPLFVGKQPVIPIVLYVSRYINGFDNPKSTFIFSGCTVMSKTYGELNAEQSGLMTQTTTIAYQKVYMVDNALENLTPSWEFDTSGKKMQGIGRRHAQYQKNEVRKWDMEAQSRMWPETRSARSVTDFYK